VTDRQKTPNSDHYEDCPQHDDPAAPNCYCEGINKANDNYFDEASDIIR
jgi:hypothetical protein